MVLSAITEYGGWWSAAALVLLWWWIQVSVTNRRRTLARKENHETKSDK